ncbi:alpha-2 adrenergic receptor [Trichonephila clavipes]|nr:alpha-2 adrenergic receptor [Trichonephila clavipes]
MKIGNNGNLVLGPFDESTPCLMIVLVNCQTKLRINRLTAVKSVAILERPRTLHRPFMGTRIALENRRGPLYRRGQVGQEGAPGSKLGDVYPPFSAVLDPNGRHSFLCGMGARAARRELS